MLPIRRKTLYSFNQSITSPVLIDCILNGLFPDLYAQDVFKVHKSMH